MSKILFESHDIDEDSELAQWKNSTLNEYCFGTEPKNSLKFFAEKSKKKKIAKKLLEIDTPLTKIDLSKANSRISVKKLLEEKIKNYIKKPASKEKVLSFSEFIQTNEKILKPKLEDFEVGQTLGKGRFAEVKLARHKKTGYLVALKKISKMDLRLSRCERLVINEILIHLSLEHENIIKLYNYFQHGEDDIYLVLEAACEGSLYEVLKTEEGDRRKLTEKSVSQLAKQLLNALNYLHRRDIIHRDLKPENILINLVKKF